MFESAVDLSGNQSVHQVLKFVRRNYPVSRSEISDKTKLSVPSVSRIVAKLLKEGYLAEQEAEVTGLGRKAKLVTLKDHCVLTTGVEYDGESLKIVVIDEKANVYAKETVSFSAGSKDPEEICKIIYNEVCKLYKNNNVDISKIYGIGMAVPGIIDNSSGIVKFSAQLGWNCVLLKEIMERIAGVCCVIDNDIKAAAFAEYNKSLARKSKITVLLYYGTGLGSAVVINGHILRGVTNSAGEIGHITQDVNGTLCSCGKTGCIQTSTAKSFLIEEAKKVKNKDIEDVKELFTDNHNEIWKERIASRFITYAALAIDTAVGAYNPDTIILCGDIIENVPTLFDDICKRYYDNYLCGYLQDTFLIKRSMLNGMGSPVGAGMLAAEEFFKNV